MAHILSMVARQARLSKCKYKTAIVTKLNFEAKNSRPSHLTGKPELLNARAGR